MAIHDDIVEADSHSGHGVRTPGAIESALSYVSEGYFDEVPETIHEKAAHLMRLLVSEHPFVDGNKRTALDVTATFYFFNGYEFDYDHEIRGILGSFATDERAVYRERVLGYLQSNTESIDLDAEIREWREDLIQLGLDHLEDHDVESDDQTG